MKRVVSLFLALGLILTVAFSFCGCSGGKLKVAFSDTVPQLFSKNSKGEYSGINYEVAKAVAEKTGKKLSVTVVSEDKLSKGVSSGKYHMGFGAGISADSDNKSAITEPFYSYKIATVVSSYGTYKTISELKNAKSRIVVGVMKDTFAEYFAKLPVDKGGFGEDNVMVFTEDSKMWGNLSGGIISAVLGDPQYTFSMVQASGNLEFTEDDDITFDLSAYITPKNKKLAGQINKAVSEIKNDGTLTKIINNNTK